MYKNEQNNENLTYYIAIDGQQIPVTEEIYRAYKQPLWRERKRQERQRAKITDGPDCTKDVGATPLSIDRMLDDGLEIPMEGPSPEDVMILDETIRALHEALAQLAPRDQKIMELFGKGLSDRKISAQIGEPQTTVSYRKRIILKALRRKLKDYE